MVSPSPEHWSPRRSLAFLAAIFAILSGALLPPAVAASPATGVAITLCSGDRALVVFDDEGGARPAPDTEAASLECAAALLSGLAAVAPPPAATPAAPRPPARLALRPAFPPDRVSASRAALRPPSTAPPPS